MEKRVDARLIGEEGRLEARGTSDVNASNNSWFSNHWKWVVMVIIIFVFILLFWIGGIYLRRYVQRKRDLKRANMAAHDAYTVESHAQTLQKTPGTTSRDITAPPMTMSGGRNGMGRDGGVGGIAPPRAGSAIGNRTRSRSGTLRSLTQNNGSHGRIPDVGPVVWGPHQHHAASRDPNNNSPSHSIPPSPTISAPPNPIYSNDRAMRSEPRFANYKPHPNKLTVDTHTNPGARSGHMSPSPVSPISPIEEGPRPGTAPPARLKEVRAEGKENEGDVARRVSKKLSKKRSVS